MGDLLKCPTADCSHAIDVPTSRMDYAKRAVNRAEIIAALVNAAMSR